MSDWIPVIVDYIYTRKGRKDDLFAHAQIIKIDNEYNRKYYQIIIPELEYYTATIVSEKIKKFL